MPAKLPRRCRQRNQGYWMSRCNNKGRYYEEKNSTGWGGVLLVKFKVTGYKIFHHRGHRAAQRKPWALVFTTEARRVENREEERGRRGFLNHSLSRRSSENEDGRSQSSTEKSLGLWFQYSSPPLAGGEHKGRGHYFHLLKLFPGSSNFQSLMF